MVTRDQATEVLKLSSRIKPLLAGHPPEVQGAILANLASIWLASHAPELRADILRMHVEIIEELIPVSEKEIFGKAGHPSTVSVRHATHVMVDGKLEKIVSKWGINADGTFAKGGFGVVTESGRRVGMMEAHSYMRIVE